MNLLFVLPSNQSFSSIELFLKQLITYLRDTGHRIGLYSSFGIPEELTKGNFYTNVSKNIIESEWNVAIVQDIYSIKFARENLKSIPILFLSHFSSHHNQCFLVENLYKIIVTNSTINFKKWGVADELVKVINVYSIVSDVLSNLQGQASRLETRNDTSKLLYFASEDDADLEITRGVIKFANYNPTIDLLVVIQKDYIQLLEDYANSNIVFSDAINSIGFVLAKHEGIVLASGQFAIAAILSRLPTIVIGINGLGGFVTPDNLKDFLRTGFNGRIGGTYHEVIPIDLLDFEIKNAIEKYNQMEYQLIEDNECNFLINAINYNWKQQLEEEIQSIMLLDSYFTNEQTIKQLIPKIADNIVFKHYNSELKSGGVLIINNSNGKVLGSIGNNEFKIASFCSGHKNIKSIIEDQQEFSSEDIVDFIRQLWHSKIVILMLPH